ncbi:MAG: hypothetical protein JWP00_3751 [Chloroflexi bacterium]|jgi:uncharacterized protein (DUF952 family)|nr:hypothetical protein [Chloroflexota bacterium]
MSQQRQNGYTFHLVPREYFEAQPAAEDYQPEPMRAGRENFIHTTEGAQNLADTGNRYYTADPGEFIVLVIDKGLVTAPVIYEDPNRIFPHIYGPLNRDAIFEIREVPRDENGRFLVWD